MSPSTKNPDITVRGGLIYVPNSNKPTHPPRHQPDTPRIKKQTTTKPDHIPAPSTPATPPTVVTPEPEVEETNVSTPPSQSD